jgi:hypothetical protein
MDVIKEFDSKHLLVKHEHLTHFKQVDSEPDALYFALMLGFFEQLNRTKNHTCARLMANKIQALINTTNPTRASYWIWLKEVFEAAVSRSMTVEERSLKLREQSCRRIMKRALRSILAAEFVAKPAVRAHIKQGVLTKDDHPVLDHFSSMLNVDLTIYTILSDQQYDRTEFSSPRPGIVIDVYQRLHSSGVLETGLLYHEEIVKADNMQDVVITGYPFACYPSLDKVRSVHCDSTFFEPRTSSIARRPQEVVSPLQEPRKQIVEEAKVPVKAHHHSDQSEKPRKQIVGEAKVPVKAHHHSDQSEKPRKQIVEEAKVHVKEPRHSDQIQEPDRLSSLSPTDLLRVKEAYTHRRPLDNSEDSLYFALLYGLMEQVVRTRSKNYFKSIESKIALVRRRVDVPTAQGISNIRERLIEAMHAERPVLTLRANLQEPSYLNYTKVVLKELLAHVFHNFPEIVNTILEGRDLTRQSEQIIAKFCEIFNVEVCIYFIYSDAAYDRSEYCSYMDNGLIVNIYQNRGLYELTTGLLYCDRYINADQGVVDDFARYPYRGQHSTQVMSHNKITAASYTPRHSR